MRPALIAAGHTKNKKCEMQPLDWPIKEDGHWQLGEKHFDA
jgi:hypothetical protein